MSWTDTISPAQSAAIARMGGTPNPNWTRREASDEITRLSAQAKADRPQADPAVTAGVYKLADGTVYVVKPNKNKSRLYAKRLVETGGTRITESGERVPEIDFVYESGAIFRIAAADRMPVDEAKRLTALYGRCIVCGRHLKAAESVERGIGPVCIKSFKHAIADPIVETADGRTGNLSDIRDTVTLAQPAAMRAARRVAAESEPVEDPEAQMIEQEMIDHARKLISQGMKALCLEADLDPAEAADVMRLFDRLAARS